jgi:hypothetical protein
MGGRERGYVGGAAVVVPIVLRRAICPAAAAAYTYVR